MSRVPPRALDRTASLPNSRAWQRAGAHSPFGAVLTHAGKFITVLDHPIGKIFWRADIPSVSSARGSALHVPVAQPP